MTALSVIAWNIRWGGAGRIDAIAAQLTRRSPDVIVLGEYVAGKSEALVELLKVAGWEH